MLFVESKWFINDVLNYSLDANIRDYRISKTVNVKLQDGTFDSRKLKYISAQQQQALIAEMLSNIKTLSTLKKNCYKIGCLKFRKEVNSIPLKQFGNTHKIISAKKMKIQGVKNHVIVNGLKQLPGNCEIANAKLLNTGLGYYITLTVFVDKESNIEKSKPNLGIDFGCSTSITCSNGESLMSKSKKVIDLKSFKEN